MKVKDIAFILENDFIIENENVINKEIVVFDSGKDSLKKYKAVKEKEIKSISICFDGGRKYFLILV